MPRPLIDPRLFTNLVDFYPSTCTIQKDIGTMVDSHGQAVPNWQNLAGHVDIPCAVAPVGGSEANLPEVQYSKTSVYIGLAGSYPTILPRMRAVVGTVTYDIQVVENDILSRMTRLTAQVITL